MHARVNTFQGSADSIEEGLRSLEETAATLRQIQGSRGLISLVDRASGRSVGITLWDSEETLAASEEAAEELRRQIADRFNEEVVSVERYEVGFLEVQQ